MNFKKKLAIVLKKYKFHTKQRRKQKCYDLIKKTKPEVHLMLVSRASKLGDDFVTHDLSTTVGSGLLEDKNKTSVATSALKNKKK